MSSPEMRAFFGDAVLDEGFLPVPNLLLRHYRQLGLTEETLVFTLQLLAMTWDFRQPPTSVAQVASRMGKSVSSVRGYCHALKTAGLVTVRARWRKGQQVGNDYDLSPLWTRLRAIAAEPETVPGGDDTGSSHPRVTPFRRQPAPSAPAPDHEERQDPGGVQDSGPLQDLGGVGVQDLGALGRQDFGGVGVQDFGGVGVQDSGGFNRNQDHQDQQNKQDQQDQQEAAAAAAALFGQMISLQTAQKLIARYPACVAHAQALVEEAANARVDNKAGLLVRLIEQGWQPAARVRMPGSYSDEEELRKFAHCPYCRGPIGKCDCIPAWLRCPAPV